MTKILAKSKRRDKTEISILNYGLHRKQRIRHQKKNYLVKLNAKQKLRLEASNDANYYEATAKEVQYAFA